MAVNDGCLLIHPVLPFMKGDPVWQLLKTKPSGNTSALEGLIRPKISSPLLLTMGSASSLPIRISKRGIRLSLFSDIFFYIIHTDLDIQKMICISEKLNVSAYIYYCVFYCGKIFSHAKLDELIFNYEPFLNEDLISSYGLHESERKKWVFNFFDRLFLEDFPQKFIETLNDTEKDKIELNDKFLSSNLAHRILSS